eukprot:1062444-Pleurochrysis_carterae.AAC.3
MTALLVDATITSSRLGGADAETVAAALTAATPPMSSCERHQRMSWRRRRVPYLRRARVPRNRVSRKRHARRRGFTVR